MKIPANPAAQSELFACRWVDDMQRTLIALQLRCFWSGGTFWQFDLWNVRQPLEIVVASVTEVSRSEAEENSD